jgi:hypothetical protein
MHKTLIAGLNKKFREISSQLNERSRRQWAASESLAIGRGGIAAVSKATGIARSTINIGIREIDYQRKHPKAKIRNRVRRPGGGRKPITTVDPRIQKLLERLVAPATRGHPMSHLRWTSKSTRNLSTELKRLHHHASDRTVARLLKVSGYSLQANRKTKEGKQHKDRNEQFEFINKKVTNYIRRGQPVISIDTKKKELVGQYRNGGREWCPQGNPEIVKSHDFPEKGVGKAVPYGIYDIGRNEGWVSVGIDHDTAEFATASIARWWREMGIKRYPKATSLMITADAGGSNSSRTRLWKTSLQGLADKTGLSIRISHFPPGTSKWNKIEHRLFCYITKNWRGRPLTSYQVVVNLISNTSTSKGLTVKAVLDTNFYKPGIKITDKEMETVKMQKDNFHGEWNYTIQPS